MIEILFKAPVIFTKDTEWLERTNNIKIEEGAIILLPEDAVLYVPPIIHESKPPHKVNKDSK
jgi:hypothetical protein